jgi:transposase
MYYVGIDVAKVKNDCIIIDSEGKTVHDVFAFENNKMGFAKFYSSVASFLPLEVRIGLEATGHYSLNLIDFIDSKQLPLIVLNPLSVNLYRKSTTLRKTKTDKIDCLVIAQMIRSGEHKPYSPVSYPLRELKTLTRHRYRLVQEQSRIKISITRLVQILFPELPNHFWSIHQTSSYELLKRYPSAALIADLHLTTLTKILTKSSRNKYSKEKAIEIREAARNSIGSKRIAFQLELMQNITIVSAFKKELKIVDSEIKKSMDEINSVILTIPGISYALGAIILAEIGDINAFENPAKLLAFAGLEPGISQSGNFNSDNQKMVKRGSKYLRWAILQAARLIAMRDPVFHEYMHKKLNEGKHYNVAKSHVARKLIRVIHKLLTTNTKFVR